MRLHGDMELSAWRTYEMVLCLVPCNEHCEDHVEIWRVVNRGRSNLEVREYIPQKRRIISQTQFDRSALAA
jgi:hypothetical protein